MVFRWKLFFNLFEFLDVIAEVHLLLLVILFERCRPWTQQRWASLPSSAATMVAVVNFLASWRGLSIGCCDRVQTHM